MAGPCGTSASPTLHTAASAAVDAGDLRLLGGALKVMIVRAPALTASIGSAAGSGEVRYRPPALEISCPGIPARRLDKAGDSSEIILDERTESALTDLGSLPDLATVGPVALPGLPRLPGLPPDLPPASPPPAESAPAASVVRLTVGAKQATEGNAIAARAVALRLEIVRGGVRGGQPGYGGAVLDLNLGVLEAAAVAPAFVARGGSPGGGGQAGGLPVTGADAEGFMLTGLALLAAGLLCLRYGRRRRAASVVFERGVARRGPADGRVGVKPARWSVNGILSTVDGCVHAVAGTKIGHSSTGP